MDFVTDLFQFFRAYRDTFFTNSFIRIPEIPEMSLK